jgi:hypothetical protein
MFRYGNDMPKHITTQTPIITCWQRQQMMMGTIATATDQLCCVCCGGISGVQGAVAPARVSGQRPDRTGDLFCEYKKGRKCGPPGISLSSIAH